VAAPVGGTIEHISADDAQQATSLRLMRIVALLIAGLLCLTACSAAGGSELHSGIAGRIVAGPTCPVEMVPPQPACAPRPLAASLRVRRTGSSRSRLVKSGSDGRFRILLEPGTYVVRALSEGRSSFPRPPAPQRVVVHAGRLSHITIMYDTGIR
jgi:hypothetical protein